MFPSSCADHSRCFADVKFWAFVQPIRYTVPHHSSFSFTFVDNSLIDSQATDMRRRRTAADLVAQIQITQLPSDESSSDALEEVLGNSLQTSELEEEDYEPELDMYTGQAAGHTERVIEIANV